MPAIKKARKAKKRPYDKDDIWAAIQEGGSSTELYIHTFDHESEAREYEEKCEEDSYACLSVESLGRSDMEKAAPIAYVAMKAALRDFLAIDPKSRIPAVSSLREAIRRMEEDDRLLDACEANGLTIPK